MDHANGAGGSGSGRGSKRLYQQDHQSAGDDEVGAFSYIRGAHNDTIVECSARLFYEWPRAK